jgi:protein-disulfide isomerase
MRRRRLSQVAIIATVTVAAVVVILVTTGGSSGGSHLPRPGSTQAIERAISTLLAGIPQSANALGQPTAPVTLQYFGDLECPYCREFTLDALPSIIRRWVRGGQLRIEYHSMETATREPKVFTNQQVAALAAGRQNKLWYFIETFYHEQGNENVDYVTEKYLHGIASQVQGLNLAVWTNDRHNPGLPSQLAADNQTVEHDNFRGTPSFLIGRTGGALTHLEPSSLRNPASLDSAIEELLGR